MHSLGKSRHNFEILKKPMPEMPKFHKIIDPEKYKDKDKDKDKGAAVNPTKTVASGNLTKTIAAGNLPKTMAAVYENQTKTGAELNPTDENPTGSSTAAEAAIKLNVNACEFVPRSKITNNEEMSLGKLQRHFEDWDERKSRLMLPWKGFPKYIRPERFNHSGPQIKDPKISSPDETKNVTRPMRTQVNKPILLPSDQIIRKKMSNEMGLKDSAADERKREHGRKVAVEALKLVEQRRMREPLEEITPLQIVHFTRLAINFTPEERIRVDRMRIIKREHIERVLREMRHEKELKLQKAGHMPPIQSTRYISLQRAGAKAESEQKQEEKPLSDGARVLPKRYIPTVKQWDELCKAKANANSNSGGNKENIKMGKATIKPEENAVMVPKTVGNIKPAPFAECNKQPLEKQEKQQQDKQHDKQLEKQQDKQPEKEQPNSSKDRELFVPRYWPPAPMVGTGEKRRGNLTHDRNISRAFSSCGLLPTPSLPGDAFAEQVFDVLPNKDQDSVKRYSIDELLHLEPQPDELEQPYLDEAHYKLGFICDYSRNAKSEFMNALQ